ncbi:WXG100 family type VII secretion target [Actinoplanes sp. TFC3]|uniref:WXG100 family type VII secretion target n=1 Tax=Actinoplanes sp. TFC3 TaxID=1710355 RepID=UPI0008323991|nr:WXG100 family type VII secretion target [Actinoplanes sp. TFC3]
MTDGLLKVNFGTLATAGADIQRAVSEMEQKLADLDSFAKPLVDTWSGDAQSAYAARQLKWTTASTDLKNILHNIKVAVDQAAQDYATTEANAAKRFS